MRLDHKHGLFRASISKMKFNEIRSEDGETIVFWSGFDSADGSNRKKKENARRLVAAWNACEGLSTIALERGHFTIKPTPTDKG